MALNVGGTTPVNADTLEGNDALGQPISTAVQSALDTLYTHTSGGGALAGGWHYIIDSLSYTLPLLASGEATVVILVANGQTPTISAGAETIRLTDSINDTSITFTEQAFVMLVRTATHWDMVDISIGLPGAHTHLPSEVGLGNVDNTSDADKIISDAAQDALNLKADQTSVTSDIAIAKIFALAGMVM